MSISTIILAAGKGTRMKSDLPKVLHQLNGMSLVEHVIQQAKSVDSDPIVLIVGHKKDDVKTATEHLNVSYADQDEQLGTGHAVQQAEAFFTDKECEVLVLSGDVPLLTQETIHSLFQVHQESGATATLLTATLENPDGYGRIVRENGQITAIVEQKDANTEQENIKEINTGIYLFNSTALFETLKNVRNDNAQGEYYLPDVIPLMLKNGGIVSSFQTTNFEETLGINTIEQLQELEAILKN